MKSIQMLVESENGHDSVDVPLDKIQATVEGELAKDRIVTLENKDGTSDVLTKKSAQEAAEDAELAELTKEGGDWANMLSGKTVKPKPTAAATPLKTKAKEPAKEWARKFEPVKSIVSTSKVKGG